MCCGSRICCGSDINIRVVYRVTLCRIVIALGTNPLAENTTICKINSIDSTSKHQVDTYGRQREQRERLRAQLLLACVRHFPAVQYLKLLCGRRGLTDNKRCTFRLTVR